MSLWAERMTGFPEGAEGFDLVFECTGLWPCVRPAMELCRVHGTFVWQGNYGAAPYPFEFLVPHNRQLEMKFPCDDGYAPCREGDDGYEQFDDARLREVFKAYVCSLGDPLALYVEDLQMAGFQMACSMATGEPCIFARRKN